MKRIIYSVTLIIFIFLTSCGKSEEENYCDNEFDLLITYMNMPRPTDSYNYPVLPCTSKWKKMYGSTQALIEACSIPRGTLKKMSTQAVIQALWEYPFSNEPIYEIGRRDAQTDFETVFYDNNAYKELLVRKDAAKQLLLRLNLVDAVCRGRNMFRPLMLELLISQPDFLSALNLNEKKELIKIVLEKDRIRQEVGAHGGQGGYTSWMLIGRTLINANYTPFVEEVSKNIVLERFLETSMFYVSTLEELRQEKQIIVDNGKNFINLK